MPAHDALFELVQSLSRSEKRYFTLSAKAYGKEDSRYLDLFKALCAQEELDDKPLKQQFGHKLSDDKARLYEALMRSLREYHNSKSQKERIRDLLTDARLLFERKLYDQAEDRLEEARNLATKLQDYLAILDINQTQRQLNRENLEADYEEVVKKLIAEKEENLAHVQQTFWALDMVDELILADIQRNLHQADHRFLKDFRAKYQPLLEFNLDSLEGFFAKRRILQGQAIVNRIDGNVEGEYRSFEATLALWQNYPLLQQEYYYQYIVDAANVMSAAAKHPEKIKELPDLIAALKSHKPPNLQAQKTLFERTTNYSIFYLLNQQNSNYSATLKEIEAGFKKYEISLLSRLSVYINICLLLFLNDEYTKVLAWSKEIMLLEKKSRNIRQDIHQANHIIALLCIQKSGDFDAIESALNRTNRYFQKKTDAKLYGLAKTLIASIKELQAAATPKEIRTLLEKLQDEISENFYRLPSGMGEISLLWTNSELTGKPIRQLRQ